MSRHSVIYTFPGGAAMVFVDLNYCFTDPKQFIRLIILIVCICFTMYQTSGCVRKLMHPPTSTSYRFALNTSIRYPAVTLCKKPGFDKDLFKNFNVTLDKITYAGAFKNFDFEAHTLTDFMVNTTYSVSDTVLLYGYDGEGNNPNVSIDSVYFYRWGQCHTVVAHNFSEQFSVSGGYFFFLKHESKGELDGNGLTETGYEIYIHDPNEILTDQLEQTDSYLQYVYLESGENMYITLDIHLFEQIAQQDNPCDDRDTYSKSKCQELCVHKQLAATVGCSLPWMRGVEDYPQCNNYMDLNSIMQMESERKELLKNCNCDVSCYISMYTTQVLKRNSAENGTFNSQLNIYYPSNIVTMMEEVVGYDWTSFLGEIGGSFGFLLGLSVIGVIELVEGFFSLVFGMKKDKKEGRKKETNRENDNMKKLIQYLTHKDSTLKQEDINDIDRY